MTTQNEKKVIITAKGKELSKRISTICKTKQTADSKATEAYNQAVHEWLIEAAVLAYDLEDVSPFNTLKEDATPRQFNQLIPWINQYSVVRYNADKIATYSERTSKKLQDKGVTLGKYKKGLQAKSKRWTSHLDKIKAEAQQKKAEAPIRPDALLTSLTNKLKNNKRVVSMSFETMESQLSELQAVLAELKKDKRTINEDKA